MLFALKWWLWKLFYAYKIDLSFGNIKGKFFPPFTWLYFIGSDRCTYVKVTQDRMYC